MALLLEDILQEFVLQGFYEGLGIDLFYDKMPDQPDRCLVVYEYAGLPEVPYEQAVHRSVQIVCRNTSTTLVKADIERVHTFIFNSLDEAGRIDFNGRFTQSTIRQTPFKIDEDDRTRVLFGFNIGVTTCRDTIDPQYGANIVTSFEQPIEVSYDGELAWATVFYIDASRLVPDAQYRIVYSYVPSNDFSAITESFMVSSEWFERQSYAILLPEWGQVLRVIVNPVINM